MKNNGQITLEFVFCMIIVFLIIFSLTKVMSWSGDGYVGIFKGHNSSMTSWQRPDQLDPGYWKGKDKYLNSVYTGKNPAQKD
ncbi:MAG: hypothetical protein HQL25_03585 [Candidatus Omnitrophica bacterium]|nr:hypothetical protein [Candidatus Omnitrophota bacterium]